MEKLIKMSLGYQPRLPKTRDSKLDKSKFSRLVFTVTKNRQEHRCDPCNHQLTMEITSSEPKGTSGPVDGENPYGKDI